MDILVPIAIFFGITVIWGGIVSEMAIKAIEHRRQPD